MNKDRKHLFDVVHEERIVDRFKVYISKSFWERLGVKDGDKVDVAWWEMTNEIRITPLKKRRS